MLLTATMDPSTNKIETHCLKEYYCNTNITVFFIGTKSKYTQVTYYNKNNY